MEKRHNLPRPPVLAMNPESGSSEKKQTRSRLRSSIASPKKALELQRLHTDADMQSCQSTCMDSVSVREIETLPNLSAEFEMLPMVLQAESVKSMTVVKSNSLK